jgi:hypothetical protein
MANKSVANSDVKRPETDTARISKSQFRFPEADREKFLLWHFKLASNDPKALKLIKEIEKAVMRMAPAKIQFSGSKPGTSL